MTIPGTTQTPDAPVRIDAARMDGPSAEIFLSPRVIDRAAFESYASRLRELIDEVATQAASLRAAAADARAAREGMDGLGGTTKGQLDLAARLLKALTQKTGEVEAMLASAKELAGAAARFEQEAERVIGAKVSSLEKRLAEAFEQFERRLQARVESHAREHASAMEEIRSARDTIRKQIDQSVVTSLNALREGCERAESLTGVQQESSGGRAKRVPTAGSLGDLVRRAAESAEKAERSAQAFADIESRAGASVQRLAESLDESGAAIDRFTTERAEIEAALSTAATAGREAEKALMERAHEAVRVFKPINELRKAADESSVRLRSLINQAETLHAGGAGIADEVRTQVERAERVLAAIGPWRALLLDGSNEAPIPEPIEAIVTQVRSEIAADLSRMAAAMSLIAGRATSGGAGSAGGRIVVRHAKPEPAAAST